MNTLASLLAAEQSGSPLGILILIVPFALLIWLMVVPQRKQKARQQQLMSTLEVGDEVITSGGIVGQITHVEDDLVHLEVDHDVVIRVAKSSIARSTSEPDADAAPSRSRGGLLSGLTGGAKSSDDADDAVDVRPARASGGTGVGAARSSSAKASTKAGSRKK